MGALLAVEPHRIGVGDLDLVVGRWRGISGDGLTERGVINDLMRVNCIRVLLTSQR